VKDTYAGLFTEQWPIVTVGDAYKLIMNSEYGAYPPGCGGPELGKELDILAHLIVENRTEIENQILEFSCGALGATTV
jgi:hypothetical protein